jgi:hypothetical protein
MVTVRVNEQREIDPAYVEKLEDEIQRLKEIVRLLRDGGGQSRMTPEVLDNDDGGDVEPCTGKLRATLARVMQENMDMKEKQERQQKEIEQLRTRLMGGGAAAGSGSGTSFVSASESSLLQAKQVQYIGGMVSVSKWIYRSAWLRSNWRQHCGI